MKKNLLWPNQILVVINMHLLKQQLQWWVLTPHMSYKNLKLVFNFTDSIPINVLKQTMWRPLNYHIMPLLWSFQNVAQVYDYKNIITKYTAIMTQPGINFKCFSIPPNLQHEFPLSASCCCLFTSHVQTVYIIHKYNTLKLKAILF